MSTLRQLAAGVAARWGRVARSDRYRAAVLMLAVPVAAYFAFDWRERPSNLVPLATNLGEAEVHAVCELLEDWSVPFELRDGGHTLLVPAVLRAELIFELSAIMSETGLSRSDPRVHGVEGMPVQRDAVSSLWLLLDLIRAQDVRVGREAA